MSEEKEKQQVKKFAKNGKTESSKRESKVNKYGISLAEERIQGGNKQCQNCFAKESLNREQIQKAQSKIEVGLKRKVHL